MKYVLVLNGSPSRNGRTANFLKELTNNLSGELVLESCNVYDLDFRPCKGCMKCRSTGFCILPKDDAHVFGEKLADADCILVGSPVYFRSMSSRLKQLFERNVPKIMMSRAGKSPAPMMKGKEIIIVVSCDTPSPFHWITPEARGAVRSIKDVFYFSGAKIRSSFAIPGKTSEMHILNRNRKRIERIKTSMMNH